MDRFDLSGKVALVTGGSRGLGRAMCLAFAEAGASVAVASRTLDACTALAGEITAATGVKAAGFACNVARWEDCNRLVEDVYDTFGTVDVLVNNAGSSPLYPSLAEISEELFDKVMALNLKGPFRLAALVGTRMVAAGGGSIINVSSVGAVLPDPDSLPYCAAKAGLNTLTVGLARAFGPTVRVNGIMPGLFLTDISKAWDPDAYAERAKRSIPLQRGGQPDEIVGAALYLASAASSYTTGAVLKVDGGLASSPA
ncbi:MAG TPA: SDR family oxidoreductase [Acidimicrobiia bacterium]|jgi:NAD(P)-dependent dehydrogenase (short-subunit alcohol dehydrogenase family)|nr:SDR family oxidoreductase [Acidimicrobiia bacterium]